DGRGRHGALLVAMPQGFERHDEALWDWFRAHLLDIGGDGQSRIAAERVPYKGLLAFTAADADLFLGREREVEAFVNRLRLWPLLAVVGPSGAGKSSFVQAGVAPFLPAGWRAMTLRPGPSPLASLAACLVQAGLAAPGAPLSAELADDPE